MRFNLGQLRIKHLTVGLGLVTTLILLYVLFTPVDVLSCPENRECKGDWYLQVDDSKEYALGDDLPVQSEYIKKRTSSGISKRYIECQNSVGEYRSRFPIGEGDADRKQGADGAEINLRVPLGVQCSLPSKCRIHIVIDYPITGLRDLVRGKHTERAYSNEFTCKRNNVPIVELHLTIEDDNVVVENTPRTRGTAREVIPVTPEQPERQQQTEETIDNREEETAPPEPPLEPLLPFDSCLTAIVIGKRCL